VELLLPALVFVAAFCAVLALPRRSARPVARLAQHQVVVGGAGAAAPRKRTAILGVEHVSAVGSLATRVTRKQIRSKSEKVLVEAGSPMPLASFLLVRATLMLGVGPLFALILLDGQGLTAKGVGMAVVTLVVFANLPLTWLNRKARKRARRIEQAIPDALDLLVVCVEGGLSLDGGIQQVARRTTGELATELQRLQADIGTGMSRRDALQDLATRSQAESLGIFCTTMVQADKMGMSVSSTLRTLVETLRTKRRQAAETQARKAPIKMLPFLVIFMIPSLFVIVLGPAVIGIMEFFRNTGG
jgi:tight adherence protein C